MHWSLTHLFLFQFSDDEEETKRVVRSNKEKRFEELTGIIRNLRNYKKIKDMSSMLSSKLIAFIFKNYHIVLLIS